MKAKLILALAQIVTGSLLAWVSTGLSTLILLTTSWPFTMARAFGAAAIILGFVAIGLGAAAQSQSSGYLIWSHKMMAQFGLRLEHFAAGPDDVPHSTSTLTTFGVAIFVAPQLLAVGALAYG